jgi:hypothetical protein
MSHACDSAQLHLPPHGSIERIEKYPHPVSHQQHHHRDPRSRKTWTQIASPLPSPLLPHPPPFSVTGMSSSSVHGVASSSRAFRARQQPWSCHGQQKITLGGTMMETTSFLESPLQQAPPARPIARNHLKMEAIGAAAISWGVVPTSCATTATHFGSHYRLHRWNTVSAGPFYYCPRHYFSESVTWPPPPRSRCAGVRAG